MNKLVFNPYRAVDWAAFTQYKGNYHCHVMQCRRIESSWEYNTVTYPAGTIFYRNGMIQNPDGSYDSTYVLGAYPWWSEDPEWVDAECYLNCGGTYYGSDGFLYVKDRLEKYAERNFDFIALAGHDNTNDDDTQNSPWSYFGFDAAANGMLELYGKELSREHHHVSLFTDYADTPEGYTEEESFMRVADEMGIVHLAHPGRYHDDLESHPWATVAWYVDIYSRIQNLHALEVVNSDDAYPNDRVLWDEILSQLMPLRPVFGCANDDAHSQNADGKAFSMALAEDLTKGHIRQAIVRGSTYCISMPEGYEVSDHVPNILAPTINSISVDEKNGTITIDANNYTDIHWYSGTVLSAGGSKVSKKIASGSTFNYANAGELKYIRAEIVGDDGKAYTQPFGLSGGKGAISGSGKYPAIYP